MLLFWQANEDLQRQFDALQAEQERADRAEDQTKAAITDLVRWPSSAAVTAGDGLVKFTVIRNLIILDQLTVSLRGLNTGLKYSFH